MNSSDLQKIIDELIGEATLALLMNSEPVSSNSLVEQLKWMKEQADEDHHRQHIALAIKEVTGYIADAQRSASVEKDDSVVHLYPGAYGTGSQRKH